MRQHHPFDTPLIGDLLCAAAGGIDASSYLLHGHVFAGLQTGNLILLGTKFDQLNPEEILRYAFTVTMFFIGVVITRLIQEHSGQLPGRLERLILIVEMLLLAVAAEVACFRNDFWVNGIMALAAASQLQEFRQVAGNPFTSLMMTGHLRKVADFGYTGLLSHYSPATRRALINLQMLIGFLAGAIITGFSVGYLNNWSLAVPILFLLVIEILSWRTK